MAEALRCSTQSFLRTIKEVAGLTMTVIDDRTLLGLHTTIQYPLTRPATSPHLYVLAGC